MKIILKKIDENPLHVMRRAGYAFQRQDVEEMSFVRVLGRAGYPRFHIYTKKEGEDLQINIHLDQKRETYGNSSRHQGEYEDSAALEREVERIKSVLAQHK